ncbi:MAG: universal stress protein, partial [Deltaproteobacteria bacterium]
ALDIARKTGAEVVLVHAGTIPDPIPDIPEAMEGAAAHFERALREQLAENRAKLEALRERVSGGGVPVSQVVIDAFADTGLAEAAKEMHADLTVVGTHGRTGVQRFLLGSVAERVVRYSDDSVLVARPNVHSAGGYRRILVPIDFSELSDRVVDAALTLAARDGHVDVLHAWELPGANWLTKDIQTARGGALRQQMAAQARKTAEELLARHATSGVDITVVDREGPATQVIQDVARAGNYDLIAMGSHGRRGLRRFILGSVAEATVRYAPCSVLVVHPERGAASERDAQEA